LYGGFREFAGSPVFDLDGREEMQAWLEQGENRWFAPAPGVTP
jgi:hypothetical protein